ncbi:type II toxin-antitoxin system tRNA(fMet)-specific endonuclease VapC [Thauera sp. Sel9]|uniref:type II toxin-antitoxin system tRNA(fMet)-specific endonuclease VapC n=1 Tax=Thauera sp. Sel9 TaxID=2974299 RepID=UPI0021E11510|nr:type II toxin-antitoxin system VapC family toxin [Thauera sp. Sel9]MCV2216758.1 type II toxin-antitoxin system VapC family toxin [Thauera sp. Sel9]
MRYMLDTNICIYLINHRPAHVRHRFEAHAVGDIGISVVTACELAYGVAKSGSTRNRTALESFLLPLDIAPFDEAAVWKYAALRAELERSGAPIGPLDTQIAAHALALDCILITDNTREFARVGGLVTENWAEPLLHEPAAPWPASSS